MDILKICAILLKKIHKSLYKYHAITYNIFIKQINERLYNDTRSKITKHVTSDHALNQWQILAELRYDELKKGL